MNSFFIKVLLGLSLVGKSPVEPVIVSIDTYVTPNQDKIYLFAEDHFGTPVLTSQEQADFITAAKKKNNTYVIVEDPTHYDGDDYLVKQFNDALFKRDDAEVDPNSQELRKSGSLRYLFDLCEKHKIPVFGADNRQEIEFAKYYGGTETAYDNVAADLAPRMRDLKQYKINWLAGYWREHMSVKKDNIKFITSLKKSIITSRDQKKWDFMVKAIDIRILHALHMIMQNNAQALHGNQNLDSQVNNKDRVNNKDHVNSKDKKNVFIFAGYRHIYRVMPVLWGNFKYTKSSNDEERRFVSSRFFLEDLDEHDRNQRFIDRFKVNITDFFAHEEEQEKDLLGECL